MKKTLKKQDIEDAAEFAMEKEGHLDIGEKISGKQDADGGVVGGSDDSRKDRNFYGILFSVLGIIIAIMVLINLSSGPEVKTMDEIIQETLEGKETEFNYLYNNYTFVFVDGLWFSQWKRGGNIFNMHLRWGPKDVEDVVIIGTLDEEAFNQEKIYVTFNFTSDLDQNNKYLALAASELSLNMVRALGVEPVAACVENRTIACEGRPIVSCDDKDKAVIWIRMSEVYGISLNGNCIVVQGPGLELLKPIDRLLYQWYGIMT